MNAPIKTEDAFHQLIHRNHMWGLWEIASQMTPQPRPEAVAHQWKWSVLEEVVKQSATAVPVGDERRAMQLFNPGLNGQWATTNTLIAAVQVLLPGEVARAHRHSPAAIRFIISGNGAYTAVEGEKVIMHEGDLILTPSWQWHDHGNETGETVVWMDGLDVPLTKALNCIFFQMHENLKADHGKPVNGSKALYGHGHLAPTWVEGAAELLAAHAVLVRPDPGGARGAARKRGLALRRDRARVHQPADRRPGHADHLAAASRCSGAARSSSRAASPAARCSTWCGAAARRSSTASPSSGPRATSSRCRAGRSTRTRTPARRTRSSSRSATGR